MKVKTRDEVAAMRSFRARPEAKFVKLILERELTEARAKYESTIADEDLRSTVDAHKALLFTLFDDSVEIG